ncbi:MAG: response regulator [Ferruginibacter sp.]
MAKNELSILLVDDDIDDSVLFEETLKSINTNIHFQSAPDGLVALELLGKTDNLPDVIFLDLNMPRLDGIECLKLLKADSKLKAIPVIMFTTSSHSKDIEETMMSGALGFVTKPTGLGELQIILSAIIKSMPHNMLDALRMLGEGNHSFIVC